MATLYFNSTANTGTGTFRTALTLANDGDVIMPDPTVFSTGEEIRVMLLSALTINKSVEIDAGRTRLIFHNESGIAAQFKRDDQIITVRTKGCVFIGRVIVSGTEANPPAITFDQCVFGSNNSSTALLQVGSGNASITLNDCLLTGSLTYAFYAAGSNLTVSLNRCTVAGNVGLPVHGNAVSSVSFNDSISINGDVDSSQFANVPDSFTGYSVDNLPPWEEWNWAPVLDGLYSSGATTGENKLDLLGNRRGPTSYALGAIETIDANYYQKRGATTLSFADPSSWTIDRGGKTPADTLSENAVFYVSENAVASDSPHSVVIQGKTSLSFNGDGVTDTVKTNESSEIKTTFSGDGFVTFNSIDFYSGSRFVNTVGSRSDAAVLLNAATKTSDEPVVFDNRGFVVVPDETIRLVLDNSNRVVTPSAGITSFTCDNKGKEILLTIAQDETDGQVNCDARAVDDDGDYEQLGVNDSVYSVLFTDKSFIVRLFDGVTFLKQRVNRTYYFTGSDNGDFNSAEDWSLTLFGDPLIEPPTVEDCKFIIP